MSYPLGPLGYIPGLHVPGTTTPIPYAQEQMRAQEAAARARAQATPTWQPLTDSGLEARRAPMAGRRFTEEHLWVAIQGEVARIGLTSYAVQKLGVIVHVSLPAVGTTVQAGDPCGEVESATAITGLHAPVDGGVAEVNAELKDNPGLINAWPWDDGWLYRVRISRHPGGNAMPSRRLLSSLEYVRLVRAGGS
jgi:glycine cleavage system H protein